MDVVIRGGTVATGAWQAVTDVGVADGQVVQLGGAMAAPTEIDARGKYVLPGGVDMHVHLTPPSNRPGMWEWVDDFESGTRAALAGGVTTVGNVSFPYQGETLADAVARDRAEGDRLSLCDYVLHPVVMEPTPANLDQIETLAKEGCTSIKIFLSFRRFDRQVPEYLEALRRAAGAGVIAMVHCEDSPTMDCACNVLREQGLLEPRHYPASRPVFTERVATARAVAFAEATGATIYVVHLAAEAALRECREGRLAGLPVYVETRPMYLHLTADRFLEPDAAKYAGAPPLRAQSDVDAMWAGIRFNDIDTLATDHAPWSLAAKLDPGLDATNLRQGVADLETCLPMFWSAGVRTGRVSVGRFVEVTATNPAKLFGMYPQKGTIAVGADADLVVWDPAAVRVVDGASMHSRADYTPYDGWEVTGWPAFTLSRGEVVAEGADVRGAPGRGRLVHRGPTQPI
ncbi:MAG: amidohydrolase family protein [Acidimicrobiales bacterium]